MPIPVTATQLIPYHCRARYIFLADGSLYEGSFVLLAKNAPEAHALAGALQDRTILVKYKLHVRTYKPSSHFAWGAMPLIPSVFFTERQDRKFIPSPTALSHSNQPISVPGVTRQHVQHHTWEMKSYAAHGENGKPYLLLRFELMIERRSRLKSELCKASEGCTRQLGPTCDQNSCPSGSFSFLAA